MRPKVFIAEPYGFSKSALALLETEAEVKLQSCTRNELPEILRTFDIFWFRLSHTIDEDILSGNVNCRLIVTPVTGLDQVELKACERKKIQVMSLFGEADFLRDVRATAEFTIAITLALIRKLPSAYGAAKKGEWDRDRFRGKELFGKTIGIIGMGRLGKLVAKYFSAFETHLLGYDPKVDSMLHGVERIGSLREILERAQIISLHVTCTPSTYHMIGSKELFWMRKGSILINTSRGAVLDAHALIEALRQDHLGGAALDVLEGEPMIDCSHPLIQYASANPNLLIFPHIGGNTFESIEKTELFLARKVIEYMRKTWPQKS